MPLFASTGLVVALALVPAAFTLWTALRLARTLDNPTLPERALARRRQAGLVGGVAIGLLIAAGEGWGLALMVGTRLVASHYARRALHGDTWGVVAYVTAYLRLVVAAYGYWFLLASVPWLVLHAEPWTVPAAVALAMVLLAWDGAYAWVFRRLLDARLVADPVFERLVTAYGLRPVALAEVAMRGGTFMNAVALPSLRWPTVVVTSTLRDRLDADAVEGVLAHELAHIEHYTPAMLTGLIRQTCALAVAGAAGVPLLLAFLPAYVEAFALWWPVVVLTAMLARTLGRQQHETDSDRRAAAITGDPEALVRALTTLHSASLLPRRWDAKFEQQASHPSLARRIQSIRAGRDQGHVLDSPVECLGRDGQSAVVLGANQLEWREGATAHRFAYEGLRELYVQTPRDGEARLVVVDAAERRWTLSLPSDRVAHVQRALDHVDGRLAPMAAAPPLAPAVAAGLAWLIVCAALLGQAFSAAAVGVLAAWRSSSPILAAAGVAALTAGALALAPDVVPIVSAPPIGVVGLVVSGMLALVIAMANRQVLVTPHAWRVLAGLSVGALAAWAAVAIEGAHLLGLYRGVREWPSALVLSTAAAAGLFATGHRRAQAGATAFAALALVGAVAGSTTVLERNSSDPFVTNSDTRLPLTLSGHLVGEAQVDVEPLELWVSPRGRHVAVRYEDKDERSHVRVGVLGGPWKEFTASDLEFVDDDRALVLSGEGDTTSLRLVSLPQPDQPGWALPVAIRANDVSWDGASSRWILTGWTADDALAEARGTLDSLDVDRRVWPAPTTGDGRPTPWVSDGTVVLARTGRDRVTRWPEPVARLASRASQRETTVWRIPDGRPPTATPTRTLITCGPSSSAGYALCAAYDGVTTRLFHVAAATGAVVPRGRVPGRLSIVGATASGHLPGWWRGTAIAIDSGSGAIFRAPETTGGSADLVTVRDGVWATASTDPKGATLRLFRNDAAR